MLPKIPDNDGYERNGHGFVYEFGAYRLIPAENLLLRNEQKLSLKPKALELLVFLVERNNRVVSKAEIIEGVWSDSFVEEANLPVHISALRKVFSGDEDHVSIDTLPKLGYRLKIEGEIRKVPVPNTELQAEETVNGNADDVPTSYERPKVRGRSRIIFVLGLVVGLLAAAAIFYSFFGIPVRADHGAGFDYVKTKKFHTFKTQSCPREASRSNLDAGGCDEAVTSFTLASNPNGNWSYGYTPIDDLSNFVLFQHAVHNNHFGSPEIPVDMWSRPDEWHPLILKNNSPLTILIQDGVVVPPNMFEMHPGPNGERSVLRWTAPSSGHFRAQGQFRSINTSGETTTDVMIVVNGNHIRSSDTVDGYNIEKPFDLTFELSAGETLDFSVGYGLNKNYECDSTGFSVMITTISLEGSGH